jgi:hypothetical protein
MPESYATVPPASLWFCRLTGPALIAVLATGHFGAFPVDGIYPLLAGPVYLVTWVGAYLVLLDGRRSGAKFALPFAFVVIAIAVLACSALIAPTSPALHDAAQLLHLLAALALTFIGWTSAATLMGDRS